MRQNFSIMKRLSIGNAVEIGKLVIQRLKSGKLEDLEKVIEIDGRFFLFHQRKDRRVFYAVLDELKLPESFWIAVCSVFSVTHVDRLDVLSPSLRLIRNHNF